MPGVFQRSFRHHQRQHTAQKRQMRDEVLWQTNANFSRAITTWYCCMLPCTESHVNNYSRRRHLFTPYGHGRGVLVVLPQRCSTANELPQAVSS
jgi:hypothetical protein